jgi:uncharacterized FlaG/YvyC family protein
MNDTSIKPINGVQQSENAALVKTLAQAQIEASVQSRSSAKNQVEPQTQNKSSRVASLENVSIHFRVDSKTNDVTVFLVDRKSRKVLRSIPADELQKLQIGDLLKLTI